MDTQWLVDLAVYVANGFLATVYFLFERAPHLVSVMAALVIALTFDRLAQERAVYAPSRYGKRQATDVSPPRAAQAATGFALALWLAATWAFGAPVPLIGAVMWLMALLGLFMMPQQRWSLLWSTKAGLITYSFAVLGYRLYLWYVSRVSPAQLADVFGGSASAAGVLAQNTGTVTTVGAWLLWVVLPAGYVYLFIQNWAAQPMSIVSPFAGAQDVIAALRTRGNEALEQ